METFICTCTWLYNSLTCNINILQLGVLQLVYLSRNRSEDSATRIMTKLRLNKAMTLKKIVIKIINITIFESTIKNKNFKVFVFPCISNKCISKNCD